MTWYEKLTGMSLDELAECLASVDWDRFLADGCEACLYHAENGKCTSIDRRRDCAEAMKIKLRSEVKEDENK